MDLGRLLFVDNVSLAGPVVMVKDQKGVSRCKDNSVLVQWAYKCPEQERVRESNRLEAI